MKIFLILILLLQNLYRITGQTKKGPPNIILITTDGFRWQDLYMGIDTGIANNPKFNEEDSTGIYKKYGNRAVMPFITEYIGKNGQLWGNRKLNNNCTVANPYWFSYPGYSELFCGYADDSINSNSYTYNPNITLLDFLQKQPAYKNKIAMFGAWFAFDRILNEPRAGFPVFNAFDPYVNPKSSIANILNKLNQEAYKPWEDEECLDVFTHNMAMDYLKTQKPKVLTISYGETDEWAHAGKYRSYLNAANQVDIFIKEIWDYIQSDNFYKNNTILLITTDHGRGLGEEWTSHNNKIARSNETWFALLGKGVKPLGFISNKGTYFQKQLAPTLASLLGFQFTGTQPLGEIIKVNEKR